MELKAGGGAEPEDPADDLAVEVAVFGGGCFWCLEALFKEIDGVRQARPGYCGGTIAAPDYQSVCSGLTGHAEVVEVRFDPRRIDYGRLLLCFFSAHDPTTLNRQGNDVGTQYRSVIFAQSARQAEEARAVIDALDAGNVYADAIVTRIEPMQPFWPAEDYHRNYFAKHPGQGYCAVVIAPKLAHFQQILPAILRREALPAR